ncbi:hypothetical protein SLEP1_g31528 [Rubroshorea leprosula]|uniref:Aminotransferase-like plant mobile domain-containing protein n=1 Tax=Rubroshorea leprosula TaxID=152421 RepID=A0AAV5KAL4_9ROSI|nr:hypothetical protein SLEP1_g31528 [Rubroshorea leprosula]
MISVVTVLKGDWIVDSSNPKEAGQFLHFPSTHIRSSSSSEAKELQLMVLESTSGPYAIEGLSHLPALEMPKLCEYVTSEGKALSTTSHAGSLPSLVLPSNHVTEHATPKAVVTQSIGRGASKWCQSIDHLGKIPFLSGFWDWSNYTAKMLSHHKMGALADAMSLANNDYCCPSSMLRALIEVWSPSTNTFLTSIGEVGISLLEVRDISGLSIRGAYYEERVTYADWLDFWYNRNPPYVDPFKSKRYLDMFELKYDGNGNVISVPKLDRPLKWTFGHERKLRGVPEQWDRLGIFVFPDGEEFVRVRTFKAAAQMAIDVTYSLVPPILACIYRGLRQLTKVPKARYEVSLPMVQQFRGILNAYQPWEPETPVPLPTHPGPRVDDGQRRADTLDFMVSIRAGYVVLRQEGCFTKKSYNPHRFARQHGFQQRLLRRHVKLPHGGEVSDLYHFCEHPILKASEARNFIPSLMKSTQKCNRSPQREPDSLQHPLSTPVARQTSRQALYEEIFSSPELRGLPGDEKMIFALDDFLETDTLEILGSLPSQIDGGVLSLNAGEQVTAEDGEVDSHDRQPSVKETVGLNPLAMTSSNPLKLKPTFSCITKPLEPISSQALWWAERSSTISEAPQLYFRMDVEPLLKTMDTYLSKVNLYLAKRDEVSTDLDVEERDKSLAALQKGISSNQIVHDSLSKEINELTKKKGSLENKIESLKKELESVEQQHSDVTSTLDLLLDKRQTAEEQLQSNQAKLIELENSKVVAVETVAEVERMRQDLEIEFEAIAKGTWFENNM